MSKEWYSASELAGVQGMPTSVRGVNKMGDRGDITRQKRTKGKGWEYHLYSLPTDTQAALLIQQQPVATAKPAIKKAGIHHYDSEGLWANYESKSETAKQQAQDRLAAINAALTLIENGTAKSVAWNTAAKTAGVSKATLYRQYGKVEHYHRSDWLAALVSGYTGRTAKAECSDEAWSFFKSDYLRLEQPGAAACYDRLQRTAAEHGWAIPSLRTLERKIEKDIPPTVRVLMREGEYALMRMYPAQQRSIRDLHALQWINGDGYQHNVFVEWPNGDIVRPKTWFWQDIYSRKILSYRTDISENTDVIRLSFGDLVEQYGLSDDVTIDNTRAAANKWMTGGVANRYRFKVKKDDPLGLFPTLGIQVHWTSVLAGKGHGQAKPIERSFGVGGLGEYVDKHPAFAGAHTGANPMAKPDNYGSKVVPLDTFLKVLDQEISAWNAKEGRRTEICDGVQSFNQAFNDSYEKATIRKATAEQRRLWLLTAEAVNVKADATVTLDAGKASGIGKNRYGSDALYEFVGKKVVVRFDPQALHDNVHLYTLDSRYIGEAQCITTTGFGDTTAAREHTRQRTAMIKATKIAAKAEDKMDAIEIAGMVPTMPVEHPPQAGSVRLFNPVTHQRKAPQKRALTAAEQAIAEELASIPLADVQQLPEQPRQRFHRWLEIDAAIAAGVEVAENDLTWHQRYQGTPEYAAERMVHEEFGLSIAQ
ncbi:transposase domain-containing protein [Sulfuriflexus mobilis]|uniref:transposase domain-containing protein n=1 Tax=Sulfuriflexus mobilis TaxID=1811807 RepID=UPI000F841CB3|nr:transposase domain-containing protein [Sulfuriflexus mobilis]